MSRYTQDGGVIPSGIPASKRRDNEHKTLFGLFRGVIIKTVYPDDPENTNKERMEYTVRVKGQIYPNAIDMRRGGGMYQYNERIRKHSEKSFKGQMDVSAYDQDLDGEIVYVMFVEGNGNVPVIVGAAQHHNQAQYKKFKKEDGLVDESEYNGVVIQTDKDSNFTIRQVGRKDVEGNIVNQEAVGALVRLGGIDGDIILKSSKSALVHMDKDGSVKIIAKDGSILTFNATDGSVLLVSKDGHAVTMNADGIAVSDKSGKSVLSVKESGVQVTADKVVVQSQEATLNSGAVNLGSNASFSGVIYENLKTLFDAHTHATGVGPSGPPLPPNTMALNEAIPAAAVQCKYVKVRGNI